VPTSRRSNLAEKFDNAPTLEVVGRELFERIGFQASVARPRRKSRYLDSWLSIISNPFTLAVAGSNAIALVGSTILSSWVDGVASSLGLPPR
jgi:hypothetical protein